MRDLAESILRHGVKEPLVVSADGFVLSGHRRLCAAKLAGLATVPARTEPVRRADDREGFVRLLREYNRQREKTRVERAREAVIDVNPDEEYRALIEHRDDAGDVRGGPALDLGKVKVRGRIGAAKEPMLAAALAVLEENRRYWPMSVRQIHYRLLNDPPWRSVMKSGRGRNRYRNDVRSYKDLSTLLTDGRIGGRVPMEAIDDETRPVTTWHVHQGPAEFVRAELSTLFKNYRRDQMAAQRDHIELVAEKNTVRPIARRAAGRYGIPVTISRGQCSVPPRRDVAERFAASGKDRLVLLMVTDLDPEGESIARSFPRSMRDDFGLDPHAVKVGLTMEQVRRFGLPPGGKVKAGSRTGGAYIGRYGTSDTWELEALEPETLVGLIREAIDAATDAAVVNAEREAEAGDAAMLAAVREAVRDAVWGALADLEDE